MRPGRCSTGNHGRVPGSASSWPRSGVGSLRRGCVRTIPGFTAERQPRWRRRHDVLASGPVRGSGAVAGVQQVGHRSRGLTWRGPRPGTRGRCRAPSAPSWRLVAGRRFWLAVNVGRCRASPLAQGWRHVGVLSSDGLTTTHRPHSPPRSLSPNAAGSTGVVRGHGGTVAADAGNKRPWCCSGSAWCHSPCVSRSALPRLSWASSRSCPECAPRLSVFPVSHPKNTRSVCK